MSQVVASSGVDATLLLTRDSQSYIQYGYQGVTDKLVAARKVSGGSYSEIANVAYNATNHKWIRIREASGTIYFDTSTDGITWSNFTSLTNPFSLGNLSVKINGGTFLAAPGTIIFDELNVSPASATKQLATLGVG